jgi:hypothetical protein
MTKAERSDLFLTCVMILPAKIASGVFFLMRAVANKPVPMGEFVSEDWKSFGAISLIEMTSSDSSMMMLAFLRSLETVEVCSLKESSASWSAIVFRGFSNL